MGSRGQASILSHLRMGLFLQKFLAKFMKINNTEAIKFVHYLWRFSPRDVNIVSGGVDESSWNWVTGHLFIV